MNKNNEVIEVLEVINAISRQNNVAQARCHLSTLKKLITFEGVLHAVEGLHLVIDTTIDELLANPINGGEKTINNIEFVYQRMVAKEEIEKMYQLICGGVDPHTEDNWSEGLASWIRSYVSNSFTNVELKDIFRHHTDLAEKAEALGRLFHYNAIAVFILKSRSAYVECCENANIPMVKEKIVNAPVFC